MFLAFRRTSFYSTSEKPTYNRAKTKLPVGSNTKTSNGGMSKLDHQERIYYSSSIRKDLRLGLSCSKIRWFKIVYDDIEIANYIKITATYSTFKKLLYYGILESNNDNFIHST